MGNLKIFNSHSAPVESRRHQLRNSNISVFNWFWNFSLSWLRAANVYIADFVENEMQVLVRLSTTEIVLLAVAIKEVGFFLTWVSISFLFNLFYCLILNTCKFHSRNSLNLFLVQPSLCYKWCQIRFLNGFWCITSEVLVPYLNLLQRSWKMLWTFISKPFR